MNTDKEDNTLEVGPDSLEVARELHIPGIFGIVEKLKMNPRTPEPEKLARGFLNYTFNACGYARRLNELFIVQTQGNKVGGFLMCYDRAFLQILINDGEEKHETSILNFIQSLEPKNDFVYGGQVGVDPEVRQRGVGRRMMERVFALMRSRHIKHMYAAILHAPVRNDVSIAFSVATGAQNVGEVLNDDGLLWGIYRWSV